MCVKYPPLQSLLPAHTLFPGLSLENTFHRDGKKTRTKMSLSCGGHVRGKRAQKSFAGGKSKYKNVTFGGMVQIEGKGKYVSFQW